MANFYLDFEGGNDSNDGTTFANRWKTINAGATAARIAPGDVIRVMASPDPVQMTTDTTWTNGSNTVTLASAVTLEIDDCDTAWTANTNVTQSQQTTAYREGGVSQQLAVAGAFTTGKIAHRQITSLDCSGYQQVTLWLYTSIAVAANVLEIRLCSDTAGNTAVDTLTIAQAMPAAEWIPITIDKGSALGSAIQSVALYAASDPGTVTIRIDHISACLASSNVNALTLTQIICRSNSIDEPHFRIQSIVGTAITLLPGYSSRDNTSDSSMQYWGPTETVDSYRRSWIDIDAGAGAIQDSGTEGSPIRFSGGWNRTDMSTQTGYTLFSSHRTTGGAALANNSKGWLEIERLFVVGSGDTAFLIDGSSVCHIDMIDFACMNVWIGVDVPSNWLGLKIRDYKWAVGTYSAALDLGDSRDNDITIGKFWGPHASMSGDGYGIFCNSPYRRTDVRGKSGAGEIKNFRIGLNFTASEKEFHMKGITFSDNGTDVVDTSGKVTLLATSCSFTIPNGAGTCLTYSLRHGGVADDHRINWQGFGLIETATDQRHTASGTSTRFKPTNATSVGELTPMMVKWKAPVKANVSHTATLWLRRTSTSLQQRFVLKGGDVPGVLSDVVAVMTEAIDTWGGNGSGGPLSITFTPTEDGVVEFQAQAWGGTTHTGWVDDFAITPAFTGGEIAYL